MPNLSIPILQASVSGVLLLNGEFKPRFDINHWRKQLDKHTLVVSADGGVRHLDALKLVPTHIVGDFDSSIAPNQSLYDERTKIEVFPVEKDETDGEIALGIMLQELFGKLDKKTTRSAYPKIIWVVGALGGRMDHVLGLWQICLHSLRHWATQMVLTDGETIVIPLMGQVALEVVLPAELVTKKYMVSLLPTSQDICGITTSGLKYSLCDETLRIGEGRGISNEITNNRQFNYAQTGGEGFLIITPES